MDLARFFRHIRMSPAKAARAFPAAAMEAIGREIAAQEELHRGEILFVVEAELHSAQLWRDVAPRERAREVFAQQGVWNTEENDGVLIYVLLADRAVEIVADRGIHARVSDGEWRSICAAMQREFSQGLYAEGAVAGVRAVSALLARHFPATGPRRNELPDRPVLL
jgi:uncharacterized membrane protein